MPDMGGAGGTPVLLIICRIADDDPEHALGLGLRHLAPRLHGEILRYRRAEDRLARLVARLALRHALLRLGFAAESDLGSWTRTPTGRPHLAGCAADFSMSHAGDLVAVAAGTGYRLGVDVEWFRPVEREAFRRFLLPREVDDGDPDCRGLLRAWSLREAVLKADGIGLLASEADVKAVGEGRGPDGRRWWAQTLDVDGGCLTLAVDRPPRRVVREDICLPDLMATAPSKEWMGYASAYAGDWTE